MFRLCLLVVLAAFLAEAFGSTFLDERGTEKIVGGTQAAKNEFPFLVAVTRKLFGTFYHAFCGASILSDRWILTAAHCFPQPFPKDTIYVRAGEHTLMMNEPGEQTVALDDLILHPRYEESTWANDIALLKLATPLDLTAPEAHAITPNDDPSLDEGKFTVAGWGKTLEGGFGTSRYLMKVDVDSVPNDVCLSAYAGNAARLSIIPKPITDNQVCAASPGKDSCSGDSGGPLFRQAGGKTVQIGIVSYGEGCARGNYPGVYTRVSAYVDWIKENMK